MDQRVIHVGAIGKDHISQGAPVAQLDRTAEGWLYVAAVVDLFSRRVVHECDDDRAACHRCTGDGDLAAGTK
jgi:hypothetical protein